MRSARTAIPALFVLLTACSSSSSNDNAATDGTAASSAEATLESQMIEIRAANDGHLPLADALDLFAGTFGEMPGADGSRFEASTDGTLALWEVMAYWNELTPEQQDAVNSALGYPKAQSFMAPKISEDTVKAHLRSIFAKLDVNDRTHAVTVALRRGAIQLR